MFSRNISRGFRKYGLSCLSYSIVAYFFFHALIGNRGFLSLDALQADIDSMTEELQAHHLQKQQLAHRVSLMTPGHVDPDLLEEVAKETLGVAREHEQLVIAR